MHNAEHRICIMQMQNLHNAMQNAEYKTPIKQNKAGSKKERKSGDGGFIPINRECSLKLLHVLGFPGKQILKDSSCRELEGW